MAQVTQLAGQLEARQEVHVITQTITLPSTTFTTHVTLGTIAAETDSPQAPGSHDDNHLTNAQIGAIVGSILGVFILVLLVIFCCLRQRRVKVVPAPKSYRDSYSSYSTRASYGGPIRVNPVRVEPVIVEPVVVEQPSPPRPPSRGYWGGYRRERRHRSRRHREYMPEPIPSGEYTRPIPNPYAPPPMPPPPAAEGLIPGAPKRPTYRAIPIPNPNKPGPYFRGFE